MARKRKQKVIPIVVDKEFKSEELQPKCFGCKESYCLRELCGAWFDLCFKKENMDDQKI